MGDTNNASEPAVSRSKRDLPPAHFLFKVESFSLLLKTDVEKYESSVFEAGGYKWRLILYPYGNKKSNGNGYISLYLAIENTNSFPTGWEVNVNYKLFVFDQAENKYLTIQDAGGAVRRFHKLKTEWGFAHLISLDTFNDANNGYLLEDTCVFGTEIFVIKPSGVGETLSMVKNPSGGTKKWKIPDFSKLEKNEYASDPFTVGGKKWKITLNPKGYGTNKGESLSVYLKLIDAQDLPSKRSIYVDYKLKVLDQRQSKHVEKTIKHWFNASSSEYGAGKFMPLGDLYVSSKGFVMNDSLIVEAQILTISVVKSYS